MAKSPTITDLFKAGAHYGHKTSRWHPKMAPFIHSNREGIHVIDLEKTVPLLEAAVEHAGRVAASGKQILFVGTKPQTRAIVETAARSAGMPYVTVRWFGGFLTNFKTMQERVKHLKDLEQRMESGELANRYSKLEVQRFQEEIDRLNVNFGGIKDMPQLPGAVFVTDVVADDLAVREANTLNMDVIAIVDTNGDPTKIDYPIPANDDALKTVTLITESIAAAISNNKAKAVEPEAASSKPTQNATKKLKSTGSVG